MTRSFFAALTVLASTTAWAAPQPKRTVILLDESGSMKKNDPARLSLEAARLYAELSLPSDHIALVAFGDRPRVLVPMSPAKASWTMQAVQNSLRHLRFDGQTTDIEAGLDAALEMLGKGQASPLDTVVLLTDGKVDLGRTRQAAARASVDRIRKKIAPALASRNIRGYTIAFTPAADQSLLRGLARSTRGEFRYLPHAAALAGAFAEMFTSASDLETLPMRDGALIADPHIQRTALVLSKSDPNAENSIRTPNDVRLTKDSQIPGVEWSSNAAYDRVTITRPQAGPWEVEAAPGSVAPVAMITASDLEFVAVVSPMDPVAGAPVLVRAELRKDGALANAFELHDGLAVRARIAGGDGSEKTLDLERARDGAYEATIDGLPEGSVGLFLRAQSPLLEREKRIRLEVAPAPAPPAPPEAAATTKVEVVTVPGPWPFVAAGAGFVAMLALAFGWMMRGRARGAKEALEELEAVPPPAPVKEIVHKPVLLHADDMKVLLPEDAGDDAAQTREALGAALEEFAELTKCQEAIQAAVDQVMHAAVEVTTGLGGLGGLDGLPDEIAQRRDAMIEVMRTVDDKIGELCDGSMNLAERIEKTHERFGLVAQESDAPADPVLTHFEINEMIIARADEQTAEEFARLKQEILDQLTSAPDLMAARSELEAKVAEVTALQTQFDSLTEAHEKTSAQLDEVTAEYQRIFAEVHG